MEKWLFYESFLFNLWSILNCGNGVFQSLLFTYLIYVHIFTFKRISLFLNIFMWILHYFGFIMGFRSSCISLFTRFASIILLRLRHLLFLVFSLFSMFVLLCSSLSFVLAFSIIVYSFCALHSLYTRYSLWVPLFGHISWSGQTRLDGWSSS